MRQLEARLRKLEQTAPHVENDKHIRESVRALSLPEARFCLWVMRWKNGSMENPTDHPKPTKENEKRAAQLLKLPSMKDWK